jgi:ABC-type multidrug transport system fused ATPase/permease subunit
MTATPSTTVVPTRGERLVAIRDRLGPFARPHRRHLRAALLASVVVTAAQLALPWPLTWLVDLASGDGAGPVTPGFLPDLGRAAAWPVVALVAVGLLLGAGEYAQRVAVARYVVRSVNDARMGLLTRPPEVGRSGTSRQPGDVLTRVVSDTARLRVGLKGVLVHVLQHGLFLLGVSVVLLVLDVWLGLAYLAGLGVAIGVALFGTDRAASMARLRRHRESGVVDDALRAAASGQGLIARPTDRARSVAIITQVKGRTAWAVQGVLGLTACLVLTLAVQFAQAERLDTAELTLVASYLLMLHYPMMRLGRQVTRLGPQLTSAERLAQLADTPLLTDGAR